VVVVPVGQGFVAVPAFAVVFPDVDPVAPVVPVVEAPVEPVVLADPLIEPVLGGQLVVVLLGIVDVPVVPVVELVVPTPVLGVVCDVEELGRELVLGSVELFVPAAPVVPGVPVVPVVPCAAEPVVPLFSVPFEFAPGVVVVVVCPTVLPGVVPGVVLVCDPTVPGVVAVVLAPVPVLLPATPEPAEPAVCAPAQAKAPIRTGAANQIRFMCIPFEFFKSALLLEFEDLYASIPTMTRADA
jgi:hypothetical protein